ncbi:transposase, partial [Pseudomonas aeruginosa]
MPRQGRVVLPNYPLHVVQRGHNRQVVFAEDEDYQRYLSDLRDLKDAFGIKVYAFCLMTNCSGQPIPDSGLSFSSATA